MNDDMREVKLDLSATLERKLTTLKGRKTLEDLLAICTKSSGDVPSPTQQMYLEKIQAVLDAAEARVKQRRS